MSKEEQQDGSPVVLKTVGVYKRPGGRCYQQGIKGGRARNYSKNGSWYRGNGHGGENVITPFDIFLIVEAKNGGNAPVSIKQELRESGKQRVTEKFLRKLEATMPKKIIIKEDNGRVCIDSQIINEWVKDAKKS